MFYIIYFHIHDKFPESDHLPLSVLLKCSASNVVPGRAREARVWEAGYKFNWSKPGLELLRQTLQDMKSKIYYDDVIDSFALN